MNKKTQIKNFFLVNANHEIGTGHMVRCKLLADELKGRGVESIFIVTNTDENIKNEVLENYQVIMVDSNKAFHPMQLGTIIKSNDSINNLLVIDSDDTRYYDIKFQEGIRSLGIKLMIITVNPHFKYYSDILLNQNIIALNQNYDVSIHTKLLLGPEYFIFDQKFRTQADFKPKKQPPFRLLITFGGSDNSNLTSRILESILPINHYFDKINVVIGRLHQRHQELINQISQFKTDKIELFQNIDFMHSLMLNTDVAITSSGLTFWELSSLGIPSFMVAASEREKAITSYLHQQHYTYQLGNYDEIPATGELTEKIALLIDGGIQNNIHIHKLKETINILGIEKVVDQMLELFKQDNDL